MGQSLEGQTRAMLKKAPKPKKAQVCGVDHAMSNDRSASMVVHSHVCPSVGRSVQAFILNLINLFPPFFD